MRTQRESLIITCPGCRKRFFENFYDLMEAEEFFCPYCGRSFGSKGNLPEEIYEELEKAKKHS